ncbi:MAG: polysaccharide deacetylase family protein [Clostridia bacterium]|nr:polysaccharide deacetylase family protein [Clostridia bacterium]
MKKAIAVLCLFLALSPFFTCVILRAEGYDKIPNDGKYIALTFDDGPHPIYTDKILAVLDEYGIKATFFQIGENLAYYGAAAIRVAEAGHEIGNHTYTHCNVNKIKDSSLAEEILLCERAIRDTTGVVPRVFRPPEGMRGEKLDTILKKCGYTPIYWSVDTYDWKGKDAKTIAEGVIKSIRAGDIILMHDFVGGRCQAIGALRIMIPELLKEGYRFVTVSELIKIGGAATPDQ